MTFIKKNIALRNPLRASAQLLGVVIFLVLATALLVTALDKSLLNIGGARQESEIELSKIRALDSMTKVSQVLVEMINRTIAIHEGMSLATQTVSAAFMEALLNAGKDINDFDSAIINATTNNLPDLNPGTTGALGGLFKIFRDDEEIFYRVQCQTNCTAALEYPKVFLIEVKEISRVDRGISTTIRTVGEIQQANLADFSLIAWAETSPEIIFGSGQHAKVGVYFDFDNIGPPASAGDPVGVIRFMNEDSLHMTQLLTNTPVSNLLFGQYNQQGHQGTSYTGTGPINIPNGVLGSTSPEVDIKGAVLDVMPSAIGSGRDASEVLGCRLELGCSNSSNCRVSIFETVVQDDGNPAEVAVIQDQAIVDGDTFLIQSQQACSLDMRPDNQSADRIYLGSANATFISLHGFRLTQSVEIVPGLQGTQRGNNLFVSLNDDALLFNAETQLLTGTTMGAIQAGASGVPSGEAGFIFEAGAVALGLLDDPNQNIVSDARPIGFLDGLLDAPPGGVTVNSYGNLVYNGPMWGPRLANTRLIDGDGNVRVGFREVVAGFDPQWLTRPNALMQQTTASSHVIHFEGMSASSGADLYEALATVGLSFNPNLGAPPHGGGPYGSDYAGGILADGGGMTSPDQLGGFGGFGP